MKENNFKWYVRYMTTEKGTNIILELYGNDEELARVKDVFSKRLGTSNIKTYPTKDVRG